MLRFAGKHLLIVMVLFLVSEGNLFSLLLGCFLGCRRCAQPRHHVRWRGGCRGQRAAVSGSLAASTESAFYPRESCSLRRGSCSLEVIFFQASEHSFSTCYKPGTVPPSDTLQEGFLALMGSRKAGLWSPLVFNDFMGMKGLSSRLPFKVGFLNRQYWLGAH